MKIINKSKNTIYVEDIDLHIPYADGSVFEVDLEAIKKSRCLRGIILGNLIEIEDYDPEEKVESSLVYLKNKSKKAPIKEPKTSPASLPASVLPVAETVSQDENIEVKIHGIFFDASGYGKVNRNLATHLSQAGIKVKISPKRNQNQLNASELKPIMDLTKTSISRNHILIDSIVPSFAEISTGVYKILYTTIESYTVPNQFIECCDLYNEIWLTSEWSASILKKYLPNKPIYTILAGVDPGLYTEDGPKFDFRPNVKDFVFVSVFGWNYRKGYDVLLRAYLDEFSDDDNVSLLIMSRYQSGQTRFHKNKIKDDIDRIMNEFPNKNLPHIVRYGKFLSENDMPKLYRACDCFVLPTRGEGAGLPPLEASLCGLPVIMTNCSAQQGYLRSNNSYMLEIDRLQEIQKGTMHLHYWDGQQFPSLTSPGVHSSLKKHMRTVVENYDAAKKRNCNLQNIILNKYTWTHTSNSAITRLKEISKSLKGNP